MAAIFSPPAAEANPEPYTTAELEATERLLTIPEAVAEALKLEMRADESVVVLGEDIAEVGGIFGCTSGLHQEFGSERIINTPICE